MERKIVLAIFAPALVALAMRIALFVLALPIFGIAFIEPSFKNVFITIEQPKLIRNIRV